jgi:hypothetical protein
MSAMRDMTPLWRILQEAASVQAPVEMPSLSAQDPSFWSDDFAKWALAECLWLDRGCFSASVLYDSFCDWCSKQDTVACMLETFEALLEDEGFLIAGGQVSGLMLKTDLKLLAAEYPVLKPKAGLR